jgi:hypothetical protein
MTQDNVFLTSTVQELLEKLGQSSEKILELWYSFALDKPKP